MLCRDLLLVEKLDSILTMFSLECLRLEPPGATLHNELDLLQFWETRRLSRMTDVSGAI